MPFPARASANTVAAMLRAALEMQYSARSAEETTAEREVMKTMAGRTPSGLGPCAAIRRAAFWVRKNGPTGVDAHEPVVARGLRLQDVRALRGGHAGVVDEDVDPAAHPGGRVEHPVVVGDPRDVARDGQETAPDLGDAAFDLEEARLRVARIEEDVDPDDVEALAGQGQDDGPADAPAGAGDDGGGLGAEFLLGQAHSSSTTILSFR